MKKIKLLIAILFGSIISTQANNVTLTNPSVVGQNLSFKISWDNSWYTNNAPNNWDAVWVFVKIQDCSTQLWSHANLSTLVGDHSAAAPLMIETVTDGKGVFIRRSAIGGGNISAANITLKLNLPAGTYNYKVYGIEMVNVPTGTFTAGGSGSESTKYNLTTIDATVQSSGLTAATIGGSSVGVPSTFPMGYNGFYCMKYEVSQQQYVDFLNSLTYNQQASRVEIAPNSAIGTRAFTNSGVGHRNWIVIQTAGNNSALPATFACGAATVTGYSNGDDGENIACNKLSPSDIMSYLDWAALRPMTELEYEKACRGPLPAVANEYVWGTTDVVNWVPGATPGLINTETPSEMWTNTVTNGICICGVNSGATAYGPARVGITATNSSGRASSGATYYGAMNMGDNVREIAITTRNAAGTAFNATLGDGELDPNGNFNANTWPTGTIGTAGRGGQWVTLPGSAGGSQLADRANSNLDPTVRSYVNGGRGVR
jgi:formylglycine-generating enzyme required for sulfatase activity